MIHSRTKELSMRVSGVYELQVVLSSSDGKATPGVALVQEFGQRERWKRAVKVLSLLWGLGIVSLLIPIAHFVLVPSFLLAGPLVAIHIFKTKDMITGGTGACPTCGKEFSIVKAPLKWPLSDLCETCQSSVSIQPEGGSDKTGIG